MYFYNKYTTKAVNTRRIPHLFHLFNGFISQHTIINVSHNNMTGEYWPKTLIPSSLNTGGGNTNLLWIHLKILQT